MWHYIWFTIYMESKDPLSYTGPEQYVYQNLVDKNVILLFIMIIYYLLFVMIIIL